MGNRSPGKIKREGRKAYTNGSDATDNPYTHQTWSGNAEYWYEGWKEEQAYKLELEAEENVQADIDSFLEGSKNEIICCPHCGLKIRITKEGE